MDKAKLLPALLNKRSTKVVPATVLPFPTPAPSPEKLIYLIKLQ